MQQSIFNTAKMVAFIHEGVCGNINAYTQRIACRLEIERKLFDLND